LDKAVHGGGAFPALVGARKEPILSPHCRAAQRAFRGVIRQADAPITQELRESLAALWRRGLPMRMRLPMDQLASPTLVAHCAQRIR
jgi:hypothetical protein